MEEKHGLSPIIATILLMAFAVALGAMIMNWSSQLVAGGAKETLCNKASLKLRSDLCYSNEQIQLDVINNGDTVLKSLALTINGSSTLREIRLKTSNITTGQILKQDIPAIKPGTSTLSVYPIVHTKKGSGRCNEPVHTTKQLPTC